MDPWSNERWNDAIRAVFRRALFDSKFRALALTDPRAALSQVVDEPLPADIKLRFVERLDEQVLVLPSIIQGQGDLSEIDISRILFHATKNQSMTPVFAESKPAAPQTAGQSATQGADGRSPIFPHPAPAQSR